MAELATIARPYAEALFGVAKAVDLNSWSALVSEMAHVAANSDLRELAHNPKVSNADIAAVFTTALKSPVDNKAKNFIAMLVENNRLMLLPEIAEQFFELKNAEQGSADAKIFSAFELSLAQVAELVATLEKKFGRRLNPIVTVDKTLIGSVRVVVGDEVLDTSIRAKLQKMQIALTA